MYEERNIQLGCGELSVECRGGTIVVSEEARKGKYFKEERFECRAMLCDSREELQQKFTQAISLNASAYGAELGGNTSVSHNIGNSNFDSFYMLVIECRDGRRELDLSTPSNDILLPAVREEIEQIHTVQQWEEFYRTKGDRLVYSIVEGSKYIIIISLNRKVKNKEFIKLLQTKLAIPTQIGAAGVAAKLQEHLTFLGQENISSVEIRSLGDSNPDFLKLIEQLLTLKTKLAQFVNSGNSSEPNNSQTLNVSDGASDNKISSKGKGRILAFSSCSYIDLLPEQLRQAIETTYDQFLQRTNRAAHYLSEIGRTYTRALTLSNDIEYFFQGHDGAFLYDHDTEIAGVGCKKILTGYMEQLKNMSNDIVAEISGLNPEQKLQRKKSIAARGCLELNKDISALYQQVNLSAFHQIVMEQLQVVEHFLPLVRVEDSQYLTPLKINYSKIVEIFSKHQEREQAILENLNQLGWEINDLLLEALNKRMVAIENLVDFYQQYISDPENKFLKLSAETLSKKQEFWAARLMPLLKAVIADDKESSESNLDINREEFKKIYDQLHQLAKANEAQSPSKSSMHQAKYDRKEMDGLMTSLGEVIVLWSELIRLQKSGQMYSPHIENQCKYLSSLLSLCLQLCSIHELTEKQKVFSQLHSTWMREHAGFLKELAGVVKQCQLKKTDITHLKETCQNYINDEQSSDVTEKWWQNKWEKLLTIAQDLDCIVTNRVPKDFNDDKDRMLQKIFAVIDFKYEAFRVGKLEAKRHAWFNKECFSGKEFSQLSIPIGTASLRFRLEGDTISSDNQVIFDIERKSPIRMDNHSAKHKTIHQNVVLKEPVLPQKPAKSEVFKIAKRPAHNNTLLRFLQMMHEPNEMRVYKKIRIKDAHFAQHLDSSVSSVTIVVFVQMSKLGKGLEILVLSERAPVGRADYGFRFRVNESPIGAKFARPTLQITPHMVLSPRGSDTARAAPEELRSFHQYAPQNFFTDHSRTMRHISDKSHSAVSEDVSVEEESSAPPSDESFHPVFARPLIETRLQHQSMLPADHKLQRHGALHGVHHQQPTTVAHYPMKTSDIYATNQPEDEETPRRLSSTSLHS